MIESRDPMGAAAPIGMRVSGQSMTARYAPGTRTVTLETALCIKAAMEIPYAQK